MASGTQGTALPVKAYSILEDYEVSWNQKLGCGISGPVRPCKKKSTGERFALKCLLDKSRARQEVGLHQRCSGHPNIVSVYDVYANEVQFPGEPQPRSRLLVVMELMDGGELFDRISKQKYFTEFQAARYTKEIASAILQCHSLNIAHRDLKPENLLLKDNSQDAVIKLSDFGFAKVDDGNLTTPHYTPYYVAPQVLEAQKDQARQRLCIMPGGSPYTYDKGCDMWSLGVIVYIMLCGYPPFYSETPSKQLTRAMKRKIMAGQYEYPQEDWAHISSMAQDLVTKLLQVNPEERLTVKKVLEHPWLHEAPKTQLQSPAILQDHNALFETKQAHSYQLTNMRLPEKQVLLKPLTAADNPILRKRCNKEPSHDADAYTNSTEGGQPPPKRHSQDVVVKTLRDIIAHCVLAPTDNDRSIDGFRARLNDLVRAACPHLSDHLQFQQVLQTWKWNGQKFESSVDPQSLAHALGEVVKHCSRNAKTL